MPFRQDVDTAFFVAQRSSLSKYLEEGCQEIRGLQIFDKRVERSTLLSTASCRHCNIQAPAPRESRHLIGRGGNQ